MPKLSPVSWRVFVERMRDFGFAGPYQEGRHPYMVKGSLTVTIPNPHEGDIRQDLLRRLLKQAGISRSVWLSKKK
ncbi:MAG: type II toxin-antitoxin system HicA family toxin [bacterium]|nr:type II toxin-antitoxin system HicA family toxin [bacterium]